MKSAAVKAVFNKTFVLLSLPNPFTFPIPLVTFGLPFLKSDAPPPIPAPIPSKLALSSLLCRFKEENAFALVSLNSFFLLSKNDFAIICALLLVLIRVLSFCADDTSKLLLFSNTPMFILLPLHHIVEYNLFYYCH